MCHIFENYMTQGYHKQWWRMNQWRITEGDAPQVVMHCIAWPILLMRRSFWCANPADALFLLMRRSCWCADPADVPILLMRQSCWCADPADAPILLMRRSCWCADPADAPILLMCRSCLCADPADFAYAPTLLMHWSCADAPKIDGSPDHTKALLLLMNGASYLCLSPVMLPGRPDAGLRSGCRNVSLFWPETRKHFPEHFFPARFTSDCSHCGGGGWTAKLLRLGQKYRLP